MMMNMTSTCLKTALSHPQNDVTFPINVKFLHFGVKKKAFSFGSARDFV